MSPSWIWSDKITNERVARVGYNHFISNEGEWNNCFSKFSNRILPPIFVSTILQSVRKENLAHYFSYDVKLRLLAHSRSFLANQKARNAIVGAENLLIKIIQVYERYEGANKMQIEQHWVIPQTVQYSAQRNWKQQVLRSHWQQNLKNGKVRYRLNINIRKEIEDSRLNAIECLQLSDYVRKMSTEFSLQEYNSS